MKAMTRQAVEILLRADNTISTDRIFAALEVLEGRAPAQQKKLDTTPEFYTIAEACELLRVCRISLYRQEKEGNLKSCDVGGRKLFSRKALLNLTRSEDNG